MVVTVRLLVALPASQSTFHLDHLLYLIIGSGLGVHSRLSSFVRCRFFVSVFICGLSVTQVPFFLLSEERRVGTERLLLALPASQFTSHLANLPYLISGSGLA